MSTIKYAALVTGGSKRIGKSISKKLASENRNVIIHYNKSRKDAVELCKKLNKNTKIIAIAVKADLNKPEQVKNIFNILKKKSIVIDCLINNASAFNYDNLKKMTPSSWNNHIVPNLYSPLLLSKEFAKALPPKKYGNMKI